MVQMMFLANQKQRHSHREQIYGYQRGRGGKMNCKIGINMSLYTTDGVPYSSVSKESACNAGDLGSIPRLGRFPGEGNGNPLQYSFLENPLDKRARQATVLGVTRVRHDLVTKSPPPRTLPIPCIKQVTSENPLSAQGTLPSSLW